MKARTILFQAPNVPGPLGILLKILGLFLILGITMVGLAVAAVAGVAFLVARVLGLKLSGPGLAPPAPKKEDSIVVEDANGKTIATLPRYN